MTQGKTSDSLSVNQDMKSMESDKNLGKKDKENLNSKVVIRRLPPSMSSEIFLDQISPIPDNDYLYFVKADVSLGTHAFSRAYINFLNQDDVFTFKEKFDGYVFLDAKGNEFPAVVEFAPFQKVPKKKLKKKDTKCGTIDQDPDYLKFLEELTNPKEIILPTMDSYLEEIEAKEKERKANNGVPKIITPLIEYLKQKRVERQRIKEEKREERRRRDLERRRAREEERKRRKAEKEREREIEKEKAKEKEKEKEKQKMREDKSKSEPQVKLLKNPERIKDRSKESDDKEDKSGSERSKENKEIYKDRTKSVRDKELSRDRERELRRERERDRERERRKEKEKERERLRERQKQRELERQRERRLRHTSNDDNGKNEKSEKFDMSQDNLDSKDSSESVKSSKSLNKDVDAMAERLEDQSKFKMIDRRYRYERRRDDHKREVIGRMDLKPRSDDYRRDRIRADDKIRNDYRSDRTRLDDRSKHDHLRYEDRWRNERSKVDDKNKDPVEDKIKIVQENTQNDAEQEAKNEDITKEERSKDDITIEDMCKENLNIEESENQETESISSMKEDNLSDGNDKFKEISACVEQSEVEWASGSQEMERLMSSQSSEQSEEGKFKDDKQGSGDDNKADKPKDPRAERRIRNKDRPAMQLYQPGQRRFSASRNSPSKDSSSYNKDRKSPEEGTEDSKPGERDASPCYSRASSTDSM